MEMLFKVVGALVVLGGLFYLARKYLKKHGGSVSGKPGGGGGSSKS